MNIKIKGEINGEEKEWFYENVCNGVITTKRNEANEDPSLLIFYSDDDGETKRVYLPFDWIRSMETVNEELVSGSSIVSGAD
jgi:hypothetical protein